MSQPYKIHPSITEDRVVAASMRHMRTLDDPGFCLACGADADGVEPDAEGYECEVCGQSSVYGADQCVIAGYYHPTPDPHTTTKE